MLGHYYVDNKKYKIVTYLGAVFAGYYMTKEEDDYILYKTEPIDIYIIEDIEKKKTAYLVKIKKLEYNQEEINYTVKDETYELPFMANKFVEEYNVEKEVSVDSIEEFIANTWNFYTAKNSDFIYEDGYRFLGVSIESFTNISSKLFFIIPYSRRDQYYNYAKTNAGYTSDIIIVKPFYDISEHVFIGLNIIKYLKHRGFKEETIESLINHFNDVLFEYKKDIWGPFYMMQVAEQYYNFYESNAKLEDKQKRTSHNIKNDFIFNYCFKEYVLIEAINYFANRYKNLDIIDEVIHDVGYEG